MNVPISLKLGGGGGEEGFYVKKPFHTFKISSFQVCNILIFHYEMAFEF